MKPTNWITKTVNDNEATVHFDQIADMLQQRDNYGVRDAHPTKRSLSIIVSRCNIMQQHIPHCETTIPNSMGIPERIKRSCGLSNFSKESTIT